MRRLSDERGAVALVVALLLVPLLGFAALAVDTAALYVARTQLHNASDAAALAVAADCARGTCGDVSRTASSLAAANRPGDAAPQTSTEVSGSAVTVTTGSSITPVFAGVLGVGPSTVQASTTVRWSPLTSATTPLPVALSVCERPGPAGVPADTAPHAVRISGSQTCEGPAGTVPSGFSVLATGSCSARAVVGDSLPVVDDVPPGCDVDSLRPLLGTVVPVPVFDQRTGTGSGSSVRVVGITGFRLTGWSTGSAAVGTGTAGACGDQPCLFGYPTGYAALDATPSDSVSGAPDLGARAVLISR